MTTAAATALPVSRRALAARGRVTVNVVMVAMILYFLLPFWWLVVAATKGNDALFSTAALWFHSPGSFFTNLRQLFTYNDGEYLRWMGNTAVYAGVSGVGATAVATLAGYAFAKYRFPGRNLLFSSLLGAIMVPATALAIPTYLLLSKVALTNTMWAVILPQLLNPFGVYLVRVYVQESLPDELLEAARMDGAGELRVLWSVALPTLKPALVTVLLFSMVGTWNNFFLPLVMLNNDKLFPLTVGLQSWYEGALIQSGANALFTLVIAGSLVAILPLIVTFLLLQRYWRGGLTVGSLK
ncbi:carbohydrate ABC transporter permease [Streptomyces sp. NBC_00582]|uniref:carbohydrate ABC transporter permease n=1 Tax=Streptomyces sp. NBC_00582 TaxID=2975783 RepID=UPI002E8068B2|nr:carbohydrate ABC transporter permease [Streptomyces sp. NBC_00582]WUB59096.1 carbohydrate ABC transporter permease [Streptomyces sp. NBC_00582]WUB67632.1 carbohydrate ABC transporter permease [Streptomyces sp. NBC_00582]